MEAKEEDQVFCQYCEKEITNELSNYGTCHICKKPTLFECKECHANIVHKDYVPTEIAVNKSRVDFSKNSKTQNIIAAFNAAKTAIKLKWWNYYELK